MKPTFLRLAVAGLATAALAVTTGCSGGSGGSSNSNASAPASDALKNASNVTVTFWHAMKGNNADALNALVAKFNAANTGKITVKPVFQGSYDDTVTKYKAAVQAKQTPSLIQVYDVGSGFLSDSGQTIPVQSFADQDDFSLDDLQPAIKGYYSKNGKLQSMPFNSSVPLLYINATAFKKAGLDPSKPPTTLDEIRTDALKLKSSGAVKYPFNAAIYGWYFEQLTAEANKTYCNNNNGRNDRATTSPSTTRSRCSSCPGGRACSTTAWPPTPAATPMTPRRRSSPAPSAWASSRPACSVVTSPRPAASSRSLRHRSRRCRARTRAARSSAERPCGSTARATRRPSSGASWEFIKFLAQPENVAYWHTKTGYFPITKAALNQPEDKAVGGAEAAVPDRDQRAGLSPSTTATQGCLLGSLPQVRALVETAIESVLTSGKDPKAALDDAASQAKSIIAKYNASAPK